MDNDNKQPANAKPANLWQKITQRPRTALAIATAGVVTAGALEHLHTRDDVEQAQLRQQLHRQPVVKLTYQPTPQDDILEFRIPQKIASMSAYEMQKHSKVSDLGVSSWYLFDKPTSTGHYRLSIPPKGTPSRLTSISVKKEYVTDPDAPLFNYSVFNRSTAKEEFHAVTRDNLPTEMPKLWAVMQHARKKRLDSMETVTIRLPFKTLPDHRYMHQKCFCIVRFPKALAELNLDATYDDIAKACGMAHDKDNNSQPFAQYEITILDDKGAVKEINQIEINKDNFIWWSHSIWHQARIDGDIISTNAPAKTGLQR